MADLFASIFTAAVTVLTDPYALWLVVSSSGLGIILGALPGISSTMALAVLLPFTFAMAPAHAMVFLMGVFYGSVYGGSLSAILINIPGTPGAMVTQLDGHPMAAQGRAGEALTYALFASTFGGLFGLVCLVIFAPLLAMAALYIGSPEYAALMLFGLTMLAYATPGSTYLGIVGGIFGLILGTVGIDRLTDVSRLDFGVPELQAGISLIPFVVGIFGLAEVLRELESREGQARTVGRIGRLLPSWQEAKTMWPSALRGSGIGVMVGAIPAAGSAIAVSIAYAQEKRIYGDREPFGKGAPRGVVTPETSNNSCIGGALIPMMTLGIPGDTMTAVLVGGLLIHGLRPGPGLFQDHPEFVASVYVSLFLAILMVAVLAGFGVRWFARILSAPRRVLLVTITLLCVVGAFAVQNSWFDVLVMIAAGTAGYAMNKLGMPTAPVVFGLVLGPLLEENLRRSLMIGGDWSVFIESPISLLLILVSLITMTMPALVHLRRRRRTRGEPPSQRAC